MPDKIALPLALMTAAALLAPIPSHANDSTAELTTGGLKFTVDPDISMQSEDLYVSAEEVRISYVFVNHAKTDKTVTIAFPMPDITGSGDFMTSLPSTKAENPFEFSVKANGTPVALTLDQHVLVIAEDKKETDETDRLRKAQIPFMPIATEAGDALDHLPAADKADYEKRGLVLIEESTSEPNKPMEKHLTPLWTLREAFTWKQTFPAGRELRLDQVYKPSVGGIVQTSVGGKNWETDEYTAAYRDKYCIDGDFTKAITRDQAKKHATYPPFREQRISYILKTGANWAGPIGDFRLVVDKGTPDKLVSFRGDGVKKIAPTQFEMRKTNFTPKKDLDILLLTPLACGEVSCQ